MTVLEIEQLFQMKYIVGTSTGMKSIEQKTGATSESDETHFHFYHFRNNTAFVDEIDAFTGMKSIEQMTVATSESDETHIEIFF